MIIKNGTINDALNKEPYIADILICDCKIKAIEKDIKVTDGEAVIDATGKQIYPGLVEAHCHIGLAQRHGQGRTASDHNEQNDAVSPQLRAIDAIDTFDANFEKALKGGVTTVCTGPGSRNAVGGTFVAMKTAGRCVDKMLINDKVAMKCAFGENITNSYSGKSISSRMTIASVIRDILSKAKRYAMAIDAANGDVSKYPSFDSKLEALLPVIRGEMPLKAHAHQVNDICTAIRIAKEFDVKMTIEHVTEGHLIVEELLEAGYPLAIGPTMTNGSKYETKHRTWQTVVELSKAGCHVCIITDSPIIPQESLSVCAGIAIREGMDAFEALKAVTIYAAEHIGVADRVGSIEVGKDADMLICDGSPFEISTHIEKVLIDGKIVSEMM